MILIDSKTRRPVPLPYHTQDFRGDPVTVVDFSTFRIILSGGQFYLPSLCGLAIITEADFMAERRVTHADKEA